MYKHTELWAPASVMLEVFCLFSSSLSICYSVIYVISHLFYWVQVVVTAAICWSLLATNQLVMPFAKYSIMLRSIWWVYSILVVNTRYFWHLWNVLGFHRMKLLFHFHKAMKNKFILIIKRRVDNVIWDHHTVCICVWWNRPILRNEKASPVSCITILSSVKKSFWVKVISILLWEVSGMWIWILWM